MVFFTPKEMYLFYNTNGSIINRNQHEKMQKTFFVSVFLPYNKMKTYYKTSNEKLHNITKLDVFMYLAVEELPFSVLASLWVILKAAAHFS